MLWMLENTCFMFLYKYFVVILQVARRIWGWGSRKRRITLLTGRFSFLHCLGIARGQLGQGVLGVTHLHFWYTDEVAVPLLMVTVSTAGSGEKPFSAHSGGACGLLSSPALLQWFTLKLLQLKGCCPLLHGFTPGWLAGASLILSPPTISLTFSKS